jgi:hypothetical protein
MSIQDAIDSIKREAASIAATIRSGISALDFSLDSLLAIRAKYNAISLDVLGQNYDLVVENRSLPPIDPSSLFDQKRIGLVDIITIGNTFLPSIPASNNLRTLQEFYLSAGENLNTVDSQLIAHPPRREVDDRFTLTLNQFIVRTISHISPSGLPKTHDEIADEIGRDTFELFVFPDLSGVAFLVIPEFISLDTSLSDTARRLGIRKDQISARIIWYGTINSNTSNFSKMRVNFQLSNSQIRVATFGDDLAMSSSGLFNGLLDKMEAQIALLPSQKGTSKILDVIGVIQEDARTFLAQIVFGTTTIVSSDILSNLREAGMADPDLESSFQNRNDENFVGVNDTANALRTLVFPAQSNFEERKTLGEAFQQSPDTPRYTNRSLNTISDFRGDVVSSSKRLVASVDARTLIIQKPGSSAAIIEQALGEVASDVAALRSAYETFLSPPIDATRLTGTRTTESANNILTRSTDLVNSLRIRDQINNFPTDIAGNLDETLAQIVGVLGSLADTLRLYFNIYQNGEVRDFLAAAVSVSSMTNFLLADGDPNASLIVTELPDRIEKLRTSVQTNILDDPASEDLFSSVSLQVGAFASVLRGTEENDPVGRLFDLPVSVIDSILPSEDAPNAFSLEMLPTQEAAMRQLRESFALLKTSRSSTNRDLSILNPNFGCSVTDAEFLLARLSGDSVSQLVTELGQA